MNPQILYDIFEKVSKSRTQGKDVIKLNVGEPEQQPPKLLFSAINRSLKKGRTTYGPAAGDPKLRDLLAKQHGVSGKNILIGPGSKFLIYALLKLLTSNNKSSVIIPLPAWSAFSLMFKDLQVSKVHYLITSEKNNWQLDPQQVEKIADKNAKTLIITNPNNPTSTLTNKNLIDEVNRIAKRRDITIVKDCAYQDLAFNKIINSLDLQNSIEIHSFSKKFCMTGFRIGYLIAKEEIVKKLTNFMQITISCVPLFIQDGAIELLNNQPDFPRKVAAIYKKRAQEVGKMFKKDGISFAQPDAGFYIFANLKKPSEKLCFNLIDKGVAIVPGTAFGPYPTYIRISLTENEERLIKGIKLIINSL